LKAGFKHAFAVEKPRPFSEEEEALLLRLVRFVVRRGLGTPAILFLQTVLPLNFIGAQALVFFKPFATAIFNPVDYERFTALLERRETIPKLVELLEKEMAERKKKKKEDKEGSEDEAQNG